MKRPGLLRRLVAVSGAAALSVLILGCAPHSEPVATSAPTTAASAPTTPAATVGAGGGSQTGASPTPTGPAPLPTTAAVSVSSVSIGSIDLKATRLEHLSLTDDGSLAAPKDPDRAGWYSDGTLPGEVGPAVIAGHVDSKTGPAVFAALGQVKPGQTVVITRTDGKKVTFLVDRVITTAKKGFPTDQVFGPTPDAELRLITCGGPYDRTVQSYVDNTIVFATKR